MGREWRGYVEGAEAVRRLLRAEAARQGDGLLDAGAIETVLRRRPRSLKRLRTHLPDELVDAHGREILESLRTGMTFEERQRAERMRITRRLAVREGRPPWWRPDVDGGTAEPHPEPSAGRAARALRQTTADTRGAVEMTAAPKPRRERWQYQMAADLEGYRAERSRDDESASTRVRSLPSDERRLYAWRDGAARAKGRDPEEFLSDVLMRAILDHRPRQPMDLYALVPDPRVLLPKLYILIDAIAVMRGS